MGESELNMKSQIVLLWTDEEGKQHACLHDPRSVVTPEELAYHLRGTDGVKDFKAITTEPAPDAFGNAMRKATAIGGAADVAYQRLLELLY
jgi:hypothetical protein